MRKKSLLVLLFCQFASFVLMADPSSSNVELDTTPVGEPIQIELLIVMALVAFILFKIFGVGKIKSPPPMPQMPSMPAPQKPLLQQVNDAIGGMQEVGDNTYAGGKMVKKSGDMETYLVMAQVDKSHIRKQERAAAQAAYERYEKTIFYLKIVVGVFIVFILVVTHETLIEWGIAIYDFVLGLFASSPDAGGAGTETTTP